MPNNQILFYRAVFRRVVMGVGAASLTLCASCGVYALISDGGEIIRRFLLLFA